jgi:uncharacterized protein YoxC
LTKLIGNTDIDEALRRLDDLIKEEMLMASTELLRCTHNIDEGVRCVRKGVEDVRNQVQGVHGKVESVDEGVQDVRDTVQGVEFGLRCINHKVQDVDNKVEGVRNRVDQVNRQHLSMPLSLLLKYHKSSQGTTSEIAFDPGYHLRTRP